jgi:hypothetical protein
MQNISKFCSITSETFEGKLKILAYLIKLYIRKK